MSFLFRSLLLAFMVLTVPLAAMASAAPPSPELQVLNHYLGDWDGTLTSLPNVKIAISCEWVLDGNFLRHSLSSAATVDTPRIASLQLMTYDTAKRVYRAWSFYSNGLSLQGEGTWDAVTKTITWTSQGSAAGNTTVTTASFTEDGVETTLTIITDAHGRIVSEIRGKKTRRK